MTNDTKANAIVASASASAVGAALIPVPIADVVMISGIQITMLITVSAVYGKAITKDTAKGLIGVYGLAHAGMWLASLVKGIPGAGTITGMIAQPIIAGSLTATLGIAFKYMSEKNIPINRRNMKEELKKAKLESEKLVAELRQKAEQTKAVAKAINFRATPEEFSKTIEFLFNISGYHDIRIRVTEVSGHEIWNSKIDEGVDRISWTPENLAQGKYIAFLDIGGLVPIPIQIIRG